MNYDNPNRNIRPRLPRPDEPRELGPADTGSIARDGYEVRVRRPRAPGYPDLVSPERAKNIEDIMREYDGPMGYDD
jgi:hypothetical protein